MAPSSGSGGLPSNPKRMDHWHRDGNMDLSDSHDNAMHLPSYLDEFGFRFNRRACSSGGLAFYRLLERAVNQDPLDNHELVAHRSPQPERPHAQRLKKAPPSLDLPRAKRPWRLADPAPPHSGSMDAPIHMKGGWPPSRGSRACRGYRLKDRAALKASWRPRR
jgi:hypothetical protein